MADYSNLEQPSQQEPVGDVPVYQGDSSRGSKFSSKTSAYAKIAVGLIVLCVLLLAIVGFLSFKLLTDDDNDTSNSGAKVINGTCPDCPHNDCPVCPSGGQQITMRTGKGSPGAYLGELVCRLDKKVTTATWNDYIRGFDWGSPCGYAEHFFFFFACGLLCLFVCRVLSRTEALNYPCSVDSARPLLTSTPLCFFFSLFFPSQPESWHLCHSRWQAQEDIQLRKLPGRMGSEGESLHFFNFTLHDHINLAHLILSLSQPLFCHAVQLFSSNIENTQRTCRASFFFLSLSVDLSIYPFVHFPIYLSPFLKSHFLFPFLAASFRGAEPACREGNGHHGHPVCRRVQLICREGSRRLRFQRHGRAHVR